MINQARGSSLDQSSNRVGEKHLHSGYILNVERQLFAESSPVRVGENGRS